MRIVDINPFSGPLLGNTTVTLVGYGFQLGSLKCRFGQSLVVPASRKSPHRIKCITPLYPTTGWVSLEVLSYSGVAESASAFFYQPLLSARASDTLLSQGLGTAGTDTTTAIGGSSDILAPALGPVRGGTIVSVTGQNFLNVESLSCRFGNPFFTVLARYLTSKTLECITPAHVAGLVNIEVSLNGQQFNSINAQYLYHEPSIIQGLTPYSGPTEGGSLITLHGTYFIAITGGASICRFGTSVVQATILDVFTIQCMSPAMPPGYVNVEVSTNLQDFSSSGTLFLVYAMAVLNVEPHVVSQLGGEEIRVHGKHFMPPQEGLLWCVVGKSTRVPALWESAELVTCETQTTRERGPVVVSIESNTTGLRSSGATLVIMQRPHVVDIEPIRGPVKGGTRVIVRGHDFPTSITDRCFFGSVTTIPRLRTAISYECFSPPMPNPMSMQITINQDTTAAPIYFRYFEEPSITDIAPQSSARLPNQCSKVLRNH